MLDQLFFKNRDKAKQLCSTARMPFSSRAVFATLPTLFRVPKVVVMHWANITVHRTWPIAADWRRAKAAW